MECELAALGRNQTGSIKAISGEVTWVYLDLELHIQSLQLGKSYQEAHKDSGE